MRRVKRGSNGSGRYVEDRRDRFVVEISEVAKEQCESLSLRQRTDKAAQIFVDVHRAAEFRG
jgi:hypothetical protein